MKISIAATIQKVEKPGSERSSRPRQGIMDANFIRGTGGRNRY
jgi:hypothetical protein